MKYMCEICKNEYSDIKDARKCERSHKSIDCITDVCYGNDVISMDVVFKDGLKVKMFSEPLSNLSSDENLFD